MSNKTEYARLRDMDILDIPEEIITIPMGKLKKISKEADIRFKYMGYTEAEIQRLSAFGEIPDKNFPEKI